MRILAKMDVCSVEHASELIRDQLIYNTFHNRKSIFNSKVLAIYNEETKKITYTVLITTSGKNTEYIKEVN